MLYIIIVSIYLFVN